MSHKSRGELQFHLMDILGLFRAAVFRSVTMFLRVVISHMTPKMKSCDTPANWRARLL